GIAAGRSAAVLRQQELAEFPGPGRRGRVALMSRHDGTLHEDVPFARERIDIADADSGSELCDVNPDICQVPYRRLMDRMVRVVDLDHGGKERAALKVRLAEPLREHVEYGQQLIARSLAAAAALGLQPLARPQLLATAQEFENQVILGRKVPVERHLGG